MIPTCSHVASGKGKGYEHFGINPKSGAIVVVRPDGYVGFLTPLDGVKDLEVYFDKFMLRRK
ncbi:hypothetical protein QCA50_011055 [Cerrena zonata]|uniref:Phenol hydroxylase-like C-terminal dimerisation domain-containing protein n=1 Tax=Cerrena zonata TaxID=2478898 RepID=A0AAW0G7T8_9APHY